MLSIPSTLCKCINVVKSITTLSEIISVDDCYNKQCVEIEPTELVPIISTLCPCEPIYEVVVNFSPPPRRTKIVKSCFVDFIKNIATTKFCNTGPTCKI